MMPGKGRLPSLSAALAGIPAGIQVLGPWSGRRQLFVRFAVEAETATIYTSDALRGELARLRARSRYHSIAIVGRDALAESEFLKAAFPEKPELPLMIDHDGQRPDALEALVSSLSLVQVTLDGSETAPALECVSRSLAVAAKAGAPHALAIAPPETASDATLLRIVEQMHGASAGTQVVVHPTGDRVSERDRRWVMWLEQAMAVHEDVRVIPRWPAAPAR